MIFVPELSFQYNNIVNFVIGVTQQCNFRCKYCCFSGNYSNFRRHSDIHMSYESMNQSIEFIKKYSAKDKSIYISFYGGEALLELNLIEYATSILYNFFGKRVEFDISTNGWMLTSSTIERILQIPNAAISVSIDGIKQIHDKNRIHISGSPTYSRIANNLIEFKRLYPEEYKQRIRVLMTMGSLDDISEVDEEYNLISQLLGNRPLLISHILPNFKENLLYKDSYICKKKFFEKALIFEQNNIQNLHVQILNELRQKTHTVINEEKDKNSIKLHTCLNDIKSCFISAEGNLYACEKVNDKFQIGNIWQGFNRSKLLNITIMYTLRRNLLCHQCSYLHNCHRCLADLNFSVKEHQLMCADYKENIKLSQMFTKHNETTF